MQLLHVVCPIAVITNIIPSNFSLLVEWRAPDATRSYHYRVNYRLASHPSNITWSEWQSTNQTSLANLDPGTAYEVSVSTVALNTTNPRGSSCQSRDSEWLPVRTQGFAPQHAISIEIIEILNSTHVRLLFSPLAARLAGGPVLAYQLRLTRLANQTRSNTTIPSTSTATYPANVTFTRGNDESQLVGIDAGLPEIAVDYSLTLRVVNEYGVGPASTSTITQTQQAGTYPAENTHARIDSHFRACDCLSGLILFLF